MIRSNLMFVRFIISWRRESKKNKKQSIARLKIEIKLLQIRFPKLMFFYVLPLTKAEYY